MSLSIATRLSSTNPFVDLMDIVWWSPIEFLDARDRTSVAHICRTSAETSRCKDWWRKLSLRLKHSNVIHVHDVMDRLLNQGIQFDAFDGDDTSMYGVWHYSQAFPQFITNVRLLDMFNYTGSAYCIRYDNSGWYTYNIRSSYSEHRIVSGRILNAPTIKQCLAATPWFLEHGSAIASHPNADKHIIHTWWNTDIFPRRLFNSESLTCNHTLKCVRHPYAFHAFPRGLPDLECLAIRYDSRALTEWPISKTVTRCMIESPEARDMNFVEWWRFLERFPNLVELQCDVMKLALPPMPFTHHFQRLGLSIPSIDCFPTPRILRGLCALTDHLYIHVASQFNDVLGLGDDLFPIPSLSCVLFVRFNGTVRNATGLALRLRESTGCSRVVILHARSISYLFIDDTCTALAYTIKYGISKALDNYLRNAGFMTSSAPPPEYCYAN